MEDSSTTPKLNEKPLIIWLTLLFLEKNLYLDDVLVFIEVLLLISTSEPLFFLIYYFLTFYSGYSPF